MLACLLALNLTLLVTPGCGDDGGGDKAGGGAGVHASSAFQTSADGWTITGDAQTSRIQPDFNTQGGNPNGLISAVDDVTGGVWYFQAPPKFLGNASATYGRYLDFDLKTTAASSPFDTFDVVLAGAGMTLGFDASPNPRTEAWTSYHVKIDEAAGWRITQAVSEDAFKTFSTLPTPTMEQFKMVIGNVTGLLIRGEFQTGGDTGYLDNVNFGAAAP